MFTLSPVLEILTEGLALPLLTLRILSLLLIPSSSRSRSRRSRQSSRLRQSSKLLLLPGSQHRGSDALALFNCWGVLEGGAESGLAAACGALAAACGAAG